MISKIYDYAQVVLNTEPLNVTIDEKFINDLADEMLKIGKEDFMVKTPEQMPSLDDLRLEVIKELVASSINYCYWQFAPTVRPMEVGSTTLYEHINEVFDPAKYQSLLFESRIHDLIWLLSKNRYPLIEDRKRHLLELCENRKGEKFVGDIMRNEKEQIEQYTYLATEFQGFASDPFLKRVSLFFMQLYRKFGMFDDLMDILPVPADYQVPKLLYHFGCINYANDLPWKIEEGILIHKHSLEEGQIRAATIVVCDMLKNLTDWNTSEIDTFLWTRRKEVKSNFHCTYTTDY